MGYYVDMYGEITMRTTDIERAFKDAQETLFMGRNADTGYYAWVDNDEGRRAGDLVELFRVFDLDLYQGAPREEDGVSYTDLSVSYSNKAGDEEQLLAVIAPYVVKGRIECTGEDHAMWAYIYKGGTMRTVEPTITWPTE